MGESRPFRGFTCSHVGIHFTTKPYIRSYDRGGDRGRIYSIRIGFGVFGFEGKEGIFPDPFDPRFTTPFVEGKGGNPAAALSSLKRKVKSLADGLWA